MSCGNGHKRQLFRPKTKLSDSVFKATPLSVLIKALYETKSRKMKEKKKKQGTRLQWERVS